MKRPASPPGDDAPPGFSSFVAARYPVLVRLGTLLTGDLHAGEDLVQSGLMETLKAWRRLYPDGDPESYTRVVMSRLAARSGRRKWRGEVPTADLPEAAAADGHRVVEESDAARRLLAGLPAEWRVTLVLRFWLDLSEEQTAEAMRCSRGTVKSRTSRALAHLRADMRGSDLLSGMGGR